MPEYLLMILSYNCLQWTFNSGNKHLLAHLHYEFVGDMTFCLCPDCSIELRKKRQMLLDKMKDKELEEDFFLIECQTCNEKVSEPAIRATPGKSIGLICLKCLQNVKNDHDKDIAELLEKYDRGEVKFPKKNKSLDLLREEQAIQETKESESSSINDK